MPTFRAADAAARGLTRQPRSHTGRRVARASVMERARFAALVPFNCFLKLACARFETFLALFLRLTPAFLDRTGWWRARAAFYRAARTVPAYRHFLRSAGFAGGSPPETDKENYVKRYRTERLHRRTAPRAGRDDR